MSGRIPSLNWLRVFEAAARAQSFARAAKQLNMSPAAVSQQVKALEEKLGTPLFQRQAHAVNLTEAGRSYLPVVQQSLLMLETATTGLFGGTREERLYVRAVLIFAQGILTRALASFEKANPDIALVLTTGVAAPDFRSHFSDLQIVFGNPGQYGADSDRLIGESLYPVALPGIAAQISAPQDLLAHPLIEVTSHRAGWSHVFQDLQLSPGAAQYRFADNTIMAATLASQGLGIALARAPAGDVIMGALGLVPCLPGFGVPGTEFYHLVYPDRASLRPAARRFRTWILDYLA